MYGYCEIKYFLVSFLGVFMGSCLFEERDIFDSFFFKVFFLYLSRDEVEILNSVRRVS